MGKSVAVRVLLVGAFGWGPAGALEFEAARFEPPLLTCPAESVRVERGRDVSCLLADALENDQEVRHGPERLHYRTRDAPVFSLGGWRDGRRHGRWTWYFRNAPGRVFAAFDYADGEPLGFCPVGTQYRELGEGPGLSTAHLERESGRLTDSYPNRGHLRFFAGCVKPSDSRFEVRHGPQLNILGGPFSIRRPNVGQGQAREEYADGAPHGLGRAYWSNGELKRETRWHRGRRHGVERTFYWRGGLELRTEWEEGRRVRATRLEGGRLLWHEETKWRGERERVTEIFHADEPWRGFEIRACGDGDELVVALEGAPIAEYRRDENGRILEVVAYESGQPIQRTPLRALPGEQPSTAWGADHLVYRVSFPSRHSARERRLLFDRGRLVAVERWEEDELVERREVPPPAGPIDVPPCPPAGATE